MSSELNGSVLVTDGAGYIGSHSALALRDAGREVVVLDNLSTGGRVAVPDGVPFYRGEVTDGGLIKQIVNDHKCGAVMHFAGSIVVPDSVSHPLDYYHNNVVASAHLLRACLDSGIGTFVFSSTAAVYDSDGDNGGALSEDADLAPANPYGRGKLMVEWMLRDIAAATKFRYAVLRYFNVAGADQAGRSGQYSKVATHLIKRACQTVLGVLPHIDVFGEDYGTPDGTCVRDYIHVTDLARAHVAALDHIVAAGRNITLHCGYGHGYSVREVLNVVDRVAADMLGAAAVIRRTGPRRAGDTASLIADTTRIRKSLNWQPEYDDLSVMAATDLAWEKQLLDGMD